MEPETSLRIGILHPGAMGISIAASAIHNNHRVQWASHGRSEGTRARATKHNLRDSGTLANLCSQSDIILSICPPDAAGDVVQQVIANNFHGLYCDANAISPERAKHIGDLLHTAGIDFVDGGIIGGPAWTRGKTWLYLSGERAPEIAECFKAGPLETRVIGVEIGKASALKMCYAAYTKGTTALLAAILAASEQLGVREDLYGQWTRDDPKLVEEREQRVRGATEKAWRFEGEMREIASTFASVGLPGEFHQAAAEIYRRLAPLKDSPGSVSLSDILHALAK